MRSPNYLFKRADLASTLLTFGHNLTSLDLTLPESWDRVPKLLPGQSRPPFPVRPKDHKVGEPAKDYVDRVGRYTYLLDAVMPCLPNLTRLRFDGPHASAHVFAWFPEKLKTYVGSMRGVCVCDKNADGSVPPQRQLQQLPDHLSRHARQGPEQDFDPYQAGHQEGVRHLHAFRPVMARD